MTTEVRISGPQMTPRSETDIRVFHGDNLKIIAASNVSASPGPQAQFYSADGGMSWGQAALPLALTDQDNTDPAVAWTSDGTAWATTIGIQGTTSRLRLYKSIDGGQTWTFDPTPPQNSPSGTDTGVDRDAMWVDNSPTSPYKDNIYAIWQNAGPARFARRVALTGSWDVPQTISRTETTGAAVGADVKTNAVGDVFAFWPDTGSRKLWIAKSTNGSGSFGIPILIAPTHGYSVVGAVSSNKLFIPAQADNGVVIYISGGAFKDATRDLVHAVWTDLSDASVCTPLSGPGTDITSPCKTRIWYARSSNGGQTWSLPTKINDQALLNDQFFPRLAVDQTNGNLVVVYYDTVNDAGRHKVDLWMQVSSDDGTSWSTPTKVTSASTDETVAGADNSTSPYLHLQLGDYIGLDVNAGQAFPAWCDRHTGGREEIWSIPLNIAVKECFFIVDKSTFGQDEVGAMLLAGQGTLNAAFYVVVEGFSASDLGIIAADLMGSPTHKPTLTSSMALPAGMTVGQPTALLAEDPSLPPTPQRFTWVYPITFTSTNGFTQPITIVTLNAAIATVSNSAQIELLQQPDPYEVDGQTTWLSTDLRVFQIKAGQTMFNATVGGSTPADAITFITNVLTNLNSGNTGGQTFENNLDPNATNVALYQYDLSGTTAVFNFAIAKVRYRATVQPAQSVRVFFRLCPALTVSTTYDANDPAAWNAVARKPGNVYRRYTNGVQYGQAIPLLGTQNNNILTIPCFATIRTTGDMATTQQDTPNVQTIPFNATGVEVDHYFGCWLDINQSSSLWYPLNPTSDGPFTSGNLKSILELVRNQHQCLLSEIVFDADPIPNGATPGTSDKLAQRQTQPGRSRRPGAASRTGSGAFAGHRPI